MVKFSHTVPLLGLAASASAYLSEPKAIYFLSNLEENAIVALSVTDGTLSEGSTTLTGGAGGNGIDGTTGGPAAPDPLFGQGSVAVAGNLLAAVNAGSNTLSLFSIDVDEPTVLTPIGEPVDTLGDFPMSVTISLKLAQACVANSGERAGIACFEITEYGLSPLDYSLRPFEIGQSTPPVGPANTVSQTFFNADSTGLFTAVKGDPMVNNTGFLSFFPVVDGYVSTEEVRSSPDGTTLLFGSVNLPETSQILATDPSFGAALIDVDDCSFGETAVLTTIEGQSATCWAAVSPLDGTVWVTDVMVNRIVQIDPNDGGIYDIIPAGNSNAGMTDIAAAGSYVYALAPGNATTTAAVAVFEAGYGRGGASAVENYRVDGLVGGNSQGMAVYV